MADPVESVVKKPWLSKTILISSVLTVFTVLSQFVPSLAIVGEWINANGVIIGSAWGALAIILRWISKDAIQLGD